MRAVYPAGETPRPDSLLSVISMVVMEPAAPLTRSNRASGVGVIVKMCSSYPAQREAALAVEFGHVRSDGQGRRAAIAWKHGQ